MNFCSRIYNPTRSFWLLIWAVISLGYLLCIPSILNASEPLADEATGDECPTYIAPDDRDNPQTLTLHGVACFEAGQYDWALTYYTRAFALSGDQFLFGGIGRSLHELGLYAPAMNAYHKFLDGDEVPSGADRIRSRVAQLEETIQAEGSELSLHSAPSDTTVYVVLGNGELYAIGSTPMQIELREGEYEFVFDDEHYHPRVVNVTASPDESSEVDGRLVSESSGLSVSEHRRRRAGVWTATTGLGIGAAGGALLVMSAHNNSTARSLEEDDFSDLSDYDERRRSHLDSAHTQRTWGTITTAAGATVLLTGMLLYFSGSPSGPAADDDNSPYSKDAQRLQLEPTVGLNNLGFRLRF